MHPNNTCNAPNPVKQRLQCIVFIQTALAMHPNHSNDSYQKSICKTTIQGHNTSTSKCNEVSCYTYYTRYTCQDSSLGVVKTTSWLPKCFPTCVTCIQLCNLGGCLVRPFSEWHSWQPLLQFGILQQMCRRPRPRATRRSGICQPRQCRRPNFCATLNEGLGVGNTESYQSKSTWLNLNWYFHILFGLWFHLGLHIL